MQLARLLFSLSELVVLQLPSLLDSGLQLWNAVEVNRLAMQGNIFHPAPLCCPGHTQQQQRTQFLPIAARHCRAARAAPDSEGWIAVLRRGQFGNPQNYFAKQWEEYECYFGNHDNGEFSLQMHGKTHSAI